MSKVILITLLTLFVFRTVKADTIDFWHVYYNNKLVKQYNQHDTSGEIIIKTDSIKNNDSITVKYFRDTPCGDCSTFILIEDASKHYILITAGIGTFSPLSFAAKSLKEFNKWDRTNTFTVYFTENRSRFSNKLFLFKIRFE